MEMVLFLIFVGLCAGGLVWFIVSTERKARKSRKSGNISQHYNQVRRHDPLRHNQARPLHLQHNNAWSSRRRHAAEEERGNFSMVARKIRFDSEAEESAEPEDLSMTEFKYTPTDIYKPSKMKR
jgi:hypothetical protein